jgi:hypothetical protein
MTATLDDVTRKSKREPTAEERAAEQMVRRARKQGLSLTGPNGLLKQLTKTVLEHPVPWLEGAGDGHRAGRLGAVRDAGKRRVCVWRSVRGMEPPSTPKTWLAISGWSAAVRYSASSLGESGASRAVLRVSSNPLAVRASRRLW